MILFVNARIFDGTGAAPYLGELLVDGKRIAEVRRCEQVPIPREGKQVVDAAACTLMPGMTEPHAHLTWSSSLEKLAPATHLPPEELALTAARNARILLDAGFTSAHSAGSPSRRLEVVLKKHIDSGGLPGPRLVPAGIERQPPTDVRELINESVALGTKAVKLRIRGGSALCAAGEQARESGVWLTGHAQAAETIKLGLRAGFRLLYECTHADAEALELLEQHRDDIFVAPCVGILQATLDAMPPPHSDMSQMKADAAKVLAARSRLMPELKRRGIRVLPGGEYGFPFNPNGRNARDLELFVRHFGFTPTEALVAATKLGGALMGQQHELGLLKSGYLADLLLLQADPTQDVRVLQDKRNFVAIMKEGAFHQTAPLAVAA